MRTKTITKCALKIMCAHMAGKIMAEGTRTQHDIGDLVKAQRGIESEKITERKVNREGGG